MLETCVLKSVKYHGHRMNGYPLLASSGDVVMDGLKHALSWLASDPRRHGDESARRACAEADLRIREAMAVRRLERFSTTDSKTAAP